MTRNRRSTGAWLLIAAGIIYAAGTAAASQQKVNPDKLVTQAQAAFRHIESDKNMSWFREHLKDAKALVIIPHMVKAGFIVGGSEGNGVVLIHDAKTGKWSYPAFLTMGNASLGLQAGVEVAEVVLMVMTQKGVSRFLSNSFKLGVDASVAAGPVGAGGTANVTADVYAFSHGKGLYGGVSLKGGGLKPHERLNRAYYGKPVTVRDILTLHKVVNHQADALIKAITSATAR